MSIKNSQTLKQLKIREIKLAADVDSLLVESKEKNKEYSAMLSKLQKVRSEIESLSDVDITVSDHAVIRYMERAMCFDIDSIRNKILSDKTTSLINSIGRNGKIPLHDSLHAVVKDRVIVTITG